MRISKTPAPPPKQYWDDYKWANRHYQGLVETYQGQWIGIYKKKVVVADPDLDHVEAALDKIVPDLEVPRLFVTGSANVY